MKLLLNLTVIAVLILFAVNSSAQTFGVKGGLSLAKMLMENSNRTYSSEILKRPGFQFGPIVDLPLDNVVSFETGLLLTGKGFRYSTRRNPGMYESDAILNTNLLYLDIPLTLKITIDLDDSKLFGVFGPYVGVGLKGTVKCNGDCSQDEENIEFGSEEDLKRIDTGINIGAGVEISPFQIGATYSLGLANLSTNTNDRSEKVKNRVWLVTVTLRFGKCRAEKDQIPSDLSYL
jgi:hypothetical protein